MDQQRVIEPSQLARLRRLELVARHAVEGFFSGKHPSPFKGVSVEYADYRPYTIGDEVRTLDWKLLAKTDRFYIKRFEEQTNVRVTIALDASESMAFGSGPTGKLDFAANLAAALSLLMLRQADAVALALFDGQVRRFLPPRSTATHFRVILEQLSQAQAAGPTRAGEVLHELAARLKRRGFVIVISDLLDDPDAIARGLAHLRHASHEVLVFHVMDDAELMFPYQKMARFEDYESPGELVANPALIRDQYLQQLEAFLARVRRGCHERGIAYELARTSTPYDRMLHACLKRRTRMKKG